MRCAAVGKTAATQVLKSVMVGLFNVDESV